MICDIKNNEANTPRYTHAPLINARANIPHKHTHTHKSLYGNKTPLTPQTHINRLIHLLRTRAPLPPPNYTHAPATRKGNTAEAGDAPPDLAQFAAWRSVHSLHLASRGNSYVRRLRSVRLCEA